MLGNNIIRAFNLLISKNICGVVSAAGGTANVMANRTALHFGTTYEEAHRLMEYHLPNDWYELMNQAIGLHFPPYHCSSEEQDEAYTKADDIPSIWLECLRETRN